MCIENRLNCKKDLGVKVVKIPNVCKFMWIRGEKLGMEIQMPGRVANKIAKYALYKIIKIIGSHFI